MKAFTPTPPADLAAAYIVCSLNGEVAPHQRLATLGFAESEIIRCGTSLMEMSASHYAQAEQLVKQGAALIAGMPLTEIGLVVSQLRIAGLQIREIDRHLTDIIGEAMRQQRLATSLFSIR